ncbi:diadenosine 5',5'''-P1,P4-tetraphosphate asymmetrical hydrolase [Flagelloscypha sp. PMI_526]|nr:diadenosine 5',5'''-P1,P4-tetraphosphate asymmetrical hydrolase [Flagelloscypha sp. PMI_526]
MMTSELFFSTIKVTSQAFYRSKQSFAIVNLKPIVPGHVLVIPSRPVARLSDLDDTEHASLMTSINKVGKVIESAFKADSLTIACQDGKAAGQTVPHVHFHILPRKFEGDIFASRNDEVYPALETAEANLSVDLGVVKTGQPLKMDDDDRKPRTIEEMVKEAEWLRTFFDS